MGYCYKPELMTIQYVIYGLITELNKSIDFNVHYMDAYTALIDSIDQYNNMSREHAESHRFDYWRRCELIHRDERKPLKVVFEWSVL